RYAGSLPGTRGGTPPAPVSGGASRRARCAVARRARIPGHSGHGQGRGAGGERLGREGDRMGRLRPALALGAALGAGACQERAQAVQGEGQLRVMVQQMVPAVERATGLRFKRAPVVERRTRRQVRDYVVHKFDADLPPAELAGAQAAYRLFGLLPDSLDLRTTMIELLTEQVAGYYDPDSNALYVAADVDSPLVRTTVSHELVHALQDQYMNLDSVMQQRRQNDRRS